MLVIARKLTGMSVWREKFLRYSFWAMNGGLALMVGLSLLPIGLAQTLASIEQGMWWARSAEFMQSPTLEFLRWLRIIGDTVFLTGVGSLAWFMLGLRTGWSLEPAAPLLGDDVASKRSRRDAEELVRA